MFSSAFINIILLWNTGTFVFTRWYSASLQSAFDHDWHLSEMFTKMINDKLSLANCYCDQCFWILVCLVYRRMSWEMYWSVHVVNFWQRLFNMCLLIVEVLSGLINCQLLPIHSRRFSLIWTVNALWYAHRCIISTSGAFLFILLTTYFAHTAFAQCWPVFIWCDNFGIYSYMSKCMCICHMGFDDEELCWNPL